MRVVDDVGEGKWRMAERVRQGMGAGTLIGEGDRPLHHALPLSYPPWPHGFPTMASPAMA